LRTRFYGEAELKRLGAGAFLAVTRGSPRRNAGILRLSYQPRGKGKARPIALVGKGLCFDTGGTNLKPHKHMLEMHTDMSGSAVALATLVALAEQRYPRPVEAWLAIAENRIGPDAYQPQEVVTAMNGTTIQVIHTDAEGRMVLADTLALASRG
jgi:leucyl aminopeptidase